MSAITIRLPEKILNEVNMRANSLHVSRSEYIKKSIERMNNELRNGERKAHLIKASQKVRENSMIINSEFDEINDDY
jgi:Arc/MetJ-type ribon-helix-helix transcriptional regulator